MWSDPKFLRRCDALKSAGLTPQFEEGDKIARGFADLGYEEFLLLPGKKLLSLYTGTVTELPADHERFFFTVYEPDALVNLIVHRGFDVQSAFYVDQRRWRVTLEEVASKNQLHVDGETLELTLSLALLTITEQERNQSGIPHSTLPKVVLASASPRRKQLLIEAGVSFETFVSNVDEQRLPGESPEEMAKRLARLKAEAAAEQFPDSFVIGADTDVSLDGDILGKPADPEDAVRMILRLQGRTHTVWGGFAIVHRNRGISHVEAHRSDVTMTTIDSEAARLYVASGEPLDKAGGYALQGIGGQFVTRIEGSYSNVIGLNTAALIAALKRYASAQ